MGKMKVGFNWMILFIVLFNCAQIWSAQKKVYFEKSIQNDATFKVLQTFLSDTEKQISEIIFEKGTYHFYPEEGLEMYRYISNHNDELIRTAFPIDNYNGLSIDGQGSEFIFHGRMIPFIIDNSESFSIKNLSIDWAMPFHSEALVVANNEEEKSFDLKISKDFPYDIRDQQLVFVKEYYEHNLGQAIMFDPERGAVAFDTESYTPLTLYKNSDCSRYLSEIKYKYQCDPRDPQHAMVGRESRLRVKELEPGLVRVYNHNKKLPRVGLILVSKGEQSQNRLAPAFHVVNTYGFDANNINVHHAGGMGLIAENSSDLILDNFNVTPSNGRMVSTTADATHFVGCRGKVELKNCTFQNQLDDASNVHGTYQEIVAKIDEFTVGVRMGHYQQLGFVLGKPGDKIGFVRLADSFFAYDENEIDEVTFINGRYQLVRFKKPLANEIKTGDLIENMDAYPEVLVENCNISNNRARGLLLSTPKKTVIRNNYFHTEMEALLIPVESNHWYESGSVTDLTIVNNKFENCNHSGFNRGVIRFVTDDTNKNIAFRDVKILDNEFIHFDNLILEINNTRNLLFKDNIISHSEKFPKLFPQNPAFSVTASENIKFKDNDYSGSADTILETKEVKSKIEFN